MDINPLAVEMAKLSLWLLTLAKDKPFTFLDHAIRPGDSLVGIRDLDQLKHFNLDGQGQQNRLILDFLRDHVQRAVELRRKIEESPADLPEQVTAQQDLMDQAEEQMARLKYAADMLIAADFEGSNERERQAALTENSIQVSHNFRESDLGFLRRQANKALGERRSFHWPLEFPEVVVERGGFDAFVCNPPFLGGKRISTTYGDAYLRFLKSQWSHAPGSADLCAYFFLRAFGCVNPSGVFGLIATNTISEGDTREVGLDHIVGSGGCIYRAAPTVGWPGLAAVAVSVVHVSRKGTAAHPVLGDQEVQSISPMLSEGVSDPPLRLAANQGLSHYGTVVLGTGFMLDPVEADALREIDPRNASVLTRFVNGDDLNSHPAQEPSRWVINFQDWSQDEAQSYEACYLIVQEKVLPQRATVKRRPYRENWWLFAERQANLYLAIADLPRCMACAITSKYLAFTFVDQEVIFSNAACVFALASFHDFALLQSNVHECWVRTYASSLETRLRYTPTDCFENYPLIYQPGRPTQVAGEAYYEHRRQVMLDRWEGLKKTYNRFHNPQEAAEDIGRLRELHVAMDHAVAAAYGWTDLELGHGFHETRQGLRYTISDPARREVLSRLLQLNHDRYAEEVAHGLHEKKKGKGKGKKAKPTPKGQTAMGDLDDE